MNRSCAMIQRDEKYTLIRMKSKPATDQKREQFLHFFIPQYDGIGLFSMSFACVLIVLGNFPLIRSYMCFDFLTVEGLRKMLGILVLLAGLTLSFCNVFTNRPRSSIEQ